MTYGTMEKIETVTVGSGGAASITFSNIPQTYNDLVLKLSLRGSNATQDYINLQFNNSTANFTSRWIFGNGSSATSSSRSDSLHSATLNQGNFTASTFSNAEVYIPNYAGSTNKSFSIDTVTENNATTANMEVIAALWSNVSAITSIKMLPGDGTGTFVQHSTATLYGITRVPAGAKATGGVIYDDASYWYHVFTSSGTFTPSQSITADCLVIAGGGGGGGNMAGAGGAGGLLLHSSQSLTAQNYTVTVGAGGAGSSDNAVKGTSGNNSSFGSLTASSGGGGGGSLSNNAGSTGGSGGGGAGGYTGGTGGTGGTPTSGQGNAGGTGASGSAGQFLAGAGGGGAGTNGSNGTGFGAASVGGNGGSGSSSYSSWATATSTGVSGVYAGGGGGGVTATSGAVAGTGGTGGGGNGGGVARGSAGTTNTGGGGGGGGNGVPTDGTAGYTGGSGIVIVRYAK